MVNWAAIVEKLHHEGLDCESWGVRGEGVVDRLEKSLGLELPGEISSLAQELGNLRISPFDLCIAGDPSGTIGAVRATQALRESSGKDLGQSSVQIMDHAGEIFLAESLTGK